MTNPQLTVGFLGTGEMGSALVRTVLGAGHRAVIWNRNAHKAEALAGAGPTVAATAGEALDADLIVVCLFDHKSVHDVLDPLAERLAGRRVLNLTTTSAEGARELARWAAGAGVDYLDGGIMATPAMIGNPGSSLLYSGSRALFDDHRELLETWEPRSISAMMPDWPHCTTWRCSRPCT